MALEDFLFFSLYSLSCIASSSTTLKDILILVLSIRTSSSVPQHPYHLRPTPPVTVSDELDAGPFDRLDLDPLSPWRVVCVTMLCRCGIGVEDDNEKKWEVLRNIQLD